MKIYGWNSLFETDTAVFYANLSNFFDGPKFIASLYWMFFSSGMNNGKMFNNISIIYLLTFCKLYCWINDGN